LSANCAITDIMMLASAAQIGLVIETFRVGETARPAW
jgi:hypothetical protein